MNDLLKNPIVVLLAGLLTLWLAFKLLHAFLSLFWLFVLAFIVFFIVNDRFRNLVKGFFNALFNR